MTNEQRSAIETAAINFFSKVISCHAENQLQFSLVLHNVIQSYDSGSRGKIFFHSTCVVFAYAQQLVFLLKSSNLLF